MQISVSIYEDFEFEQIYHLFTRVSGNEQIFRQEKNYHYFLDKVSKYLLPYLEIYAYCLVPKCFSFLICFKSQKEICDYLEIEKKELSKEQEHKFLMQPISNLLNSYAKAYNKAYNREGALFVDFIKREKIDDEALLKATLKNIHLLPLQNTDSKLPEDWKYSSYKSYLEPHKPSKIEKNLMMSFFKDVNDFLELHQIS